MGWIQRILDKSFRVSDAEPFPEVEERATSTSNLKYPDQYLYNTFGITSNGVSVNPVSAMTISTVYACVRILAETVSSLPLKLKQKKDGFTRDATEKSLYYLLKEEPNPAQTSFEWREMSQGHLGLVGNAYTLIHRDNRGTPIMLEPLNPNDMNVFKDEDVGIIYNYQDQTYSPYNILHVKGLTADGIEGVSPVTLMRNTFGLALHAGQQEKNLYEKGMNPSGVLQTEQAMTEEQLEKIRKQLTTAHVGSSNSGKPLVLDGGLSWKDIGFSNVDAQFLESRKFDVEEIARAYRIPLNLLQSMEKSTSWGTGIEQQNIAFIEYTMRPWLVRWEKSLNRILLSEQEKADGYFFNFNLNALLRGDFKTRAEGYQKFIDMGLMSINEGRELEDMNPIEGGDEHYRPLNTTTVDMIGKEEEVNV